MGTESAAKLEVESPMPSCGTALSPKTSSRCDSGPRDAAGVMRNMTKFALSVLPATSPASYGAIKAVGGDLLVAFDPNDCRRHHRQPFSAAEFSPSSSSSTAMSTYAPSGERSTYGDLFANKLMTPLPFRAALGGRCDLREAAGAQPD